MNVNYKLLCSLAFLLAFAACDRTVDFVPPSSSNSIAEVFRDKESTTYEFLVEATAGDSLVLDDQSGFAPTILIIPENLCTYGNGESCEGELEVQLVQAFTKGDMIFSGIPTTSNGAPLESGGAFYLNITQNGEQLSIRPDASFKIKASMDRTESQSENMMFYLLTRQADISDWRLEGELAGIDEDYYSLEFNQLDQWMNIDYPLDVALNNFDIDVIKDQLPVSDAEVFIAFTEFNTVVKADYALSDEQYHVDIPLNAEIEIVAIKKEGEQWLWSVSQALESERSTELTLEPVSYEALVAKLRTL